MKKLLTLCMILYSGNALALSTPPNCPTASGTQALNYLTSANAFSCNTVATGSETISVGNTSITGGANTRVLFDNSGVLGEYTITGTGNVVMSASPAFTGTPNFNGNGLNINGQNGIWIDNTNVNLSIGSSSMSSTVSQVGGGFNGQYNLGNGLGALTAVGTGSFNVATGAVSQQNTSIGIDNSSYGAVSLWKNTTGSSNNSFGESSSAFNTTGSLNDVFGAYAMEYNTDGSQNSLKGYLSGQNVLHANAMTCDGFESCTGIANSVGNYTVTGSTCVGAFCLYSEQTASYNTGLGNSALYTVTTGTANIGVGYGAGGITLTTGHNDLLFGNGVDTPATGTSNFMNLGNAIYATGINYGGGSTPAGNIGIGTNAPITLLQIGSVPTSGNAMNVSSSGVITNATWNGVAIGTAYMTGVLPVANGGTAASSAGGTSLDNITGFSSTGFLTRTGSGTYAFQSATNGVTLGNIAQSAANTMLGNWTGSTANNSANAMPSCSDSGGNHLNYVSGTGVTCGTSDSHAGTVTSIATTSPITGGTITTTGTIACATCATTTNGGALSATSPVTISAAGVIALTNPLPVANGGTNATSASITAFNNITGYSAAGSTGTTSTNLVFSTSPTFITPALGVASATSVAVTGTSVGSGEGIYAQAVNGALGFFSNSAAVGQIDKNGVPKFTGNSYVSSDQSTTSNTTLAAISGLTVTLTAGKAYMFKLVIYTTEGAVGGLKLDMGGGTATATTFMADGYLTTASFTVNSLDPFTSLTTAYINTAGATITSASTVVEGFILVNGAGTFIPRWAQNTSNGTATVIKTGSHMEFYQLN